MIKEITKYTEDKTVLVIGTNLFAGFLSQGAQDKCSVIIETGGVGNYYLPDKTETHIQIISRAFNYHEAKNLANITYWLFNGGKRLTLPEIDDGVWIVDSSEAIQIPQSIGQDEKGRFEFSTNYILRISRP